MRNFVFDDLLEKVENTFQRLLVEMIRLKFSFESTNKMHSNNRRPKCIQIFTSCQELTHESPTLGQINIDLRCPSF